MGTCCRGGREPSAPSGFPGLVCGPGVGTESAWMDQKGKEGAVTIWETVLGLLECRG